MRYLIYPYVKEGEEYTLSDDVMRLVWYRMVAEKKAQVTFYDGGIRTEGDFLAWMKDPQNLPLIVIDGEHKSICMLAWLNNIKDGIAMCHFCVLGPYRKGLGQAVMNYWSSWKDDTGQPLLKTIIGITPEVYHTALKMIKHVGFTLVGIVPNFCKLAYENIRVGGMVSYYCPEGG
jgi:hypothetical protein